MGAPGYIAAFLVLAWGGLLGFYARDLRRCWREPVLRHPVVVFESDDWGAGPLDQAQALAGLGEVLARFRDATGRPPVAALGIILATADTARIRAAGGAAYFSKDLLDPAYAPLRAAIETGVRRGVFALHLHGMEHYWPPTLMRAAAQDAGIRDWLLADGIPATESLPSPLQARWTDASELPSRALPEDALQAAVAGEAGLFAACFHARPRVAVATTFVWTEAVEARWAEAGIDVIVTPGARHTRREAGGEPGGTDRRMLNGETSRHGQLYLVRDVYFEPALGHTPERLVREAEARARLGRPCVVEMHRANFLGPHRPGAALQALETALERLRQAFPDLRFLSSLELAEALRGRAPELVETAAAPRLRAWLRRLRQVRGFARLSRMSGLALPLWLAGRAVGA